MIYYISEYNYGNITASSPTFIAPISINKDAANSIGMVLHTCPDCDESNWYDCNESRTITKEVDREYEALKMKIRQKIIDLQGQIITAYTDPTSAIADNPNDILRYTAMVEALKAMLN